MHTDGSDWTAPLWVACDTVRFSRDMVHIKTVACRIIYYEVFLSDSETILIQSTWKKDEIESAMYFQRGTTELSRAMIQPLG